MIDRIEENYSTESLMAVSVLVIGGLTLMNSFLLIGDGVDVSLDSETAEISYEDIMPEGEPEVYGPTLAVAYDDVSQTDPVSTEETINEMAEIDRDISHEELSEDEVQRYVSIAGSISCEYCCDVPAIIFENGEPACGCEHSYAMRGLAKYLITEHEDEFSDEEILEELGKWKTRFFPDQHLEKAQIMKEEGLETDFISLTSNEYRGIEQQAQTGGNGGGMVGAC